jgi:precorrin-6B methylase 2
MQERLNNLKESNPRAKIVVNVLRESNAASVVRARADKAVVDVAVVVVSVTDVRQHARMRDANPRAPNPKAAITSNLSPSR